MIVSYCPNCGNQTNVGAKFCENCGYALQSATVQTIQTQSQRAPEPVSKLDFLNDAVIRNYPPIAPATNLPFRLQDGEIILKEFRPKRKVIVKFAFGGIITTLFLLLFLILPLSSLLLTTSASGGKAPAALIVIVGVFGVLVALILILSIVSGFLGYKKYSYWITNHRTIGRRGIIGYTMDSMPLENVADVIISRGIIDRILGLSTVYIQPIGGSGFMVPVRGMGLNRFGGTNNFQGLTPSEAPDIQQLIFHLRDLRKRETGRIL
ncbi:MAG: PH domain-containing protein [Candidatus Thermoplasmatota archaeon]|nr:PH domain-containing protein [Candidatus Sysuiplasma jiujiangense]MBX8639034.1 PH domain-containing protein [Candidatus Sysuiplasma jiujiangense]MCL4317728.1 PH domain-containing protein [Candidatus Thermoplasmatota archaeon]MCL5253316.1 PH domain-containing protein [Candidatus Thermoplasmatota archaeon]